MEGKIREIERGDFQEVLAMMREFYASPLVFTNGSDEIFKRDLECCLEKGLYLEGYVFEGEGRLLGYALVAKSFSTEFGKRCLWIEDLYVLKEGRGQGFGRRFIEMLINKNPDSLIRLDVEAENPKAIGFYQRCGFSFLPYLQMIRD